MIMMAGFARTIYISRVGWSRWIVIAFLLRYILIQITKQVRAKRSLFVIQKECIFVDSKNAETWDDIIKTSFMMRTFGFRSNQENKI